MASLRSASRKDGGSYVQVLYRLDVKQTSTCQRHRCTGYRPDYSWIALPHFPRDEQPAHQRGAVLDHPGLYVIGLPFLFRMASSLVGGVGSDARHIAHLIARDQQKADRSSHERRNEGTRL